MFSWGKKHSLVETLGINTMKFRESRGPHIKACADLLFNTICKDLIAASTSSVESEVVFNFALPETQKKILGFSSFTSQELDAILTSVVAKLKEEKLEARHAGITLPVLTVSWSVPVAQPQAQVQAQAPQAQPAAQETKTEEIKAEVTETKDQ